MAVTKAKGPALVKERGQWERTLTAGGLGTNIGRALYALGPKQQRKPRRTSWPRAEARIGKEERKG